MDHPCDHYNGDPTLTKLLAYLDNRPEALSAIKCASFDPEGAAHLPNSAFAWEDMRRYPIHSREDTIASIAYRSKYAGALRIPADVDEKLAQAAEAYGVKPEMFRAYSAKTAAAQPPVPYALPDQERLPLGSPAQIKVACEVLARDGHSLPLSTRVDAYVKVAAAAADHGMPVDGDIGAYAGLNSCHTQVMRDRIGMRAATTKIAACVTAYDALDAALGQMPPVIQERETLLRLASKIAQLDEAADIQQHYGKKIFDPMKTVFNSGEKIAACANVGTEKFMALPPEVWKQVDVPEMADIAASGDVARFKQVYETLPMDIKMVLEKQL